MHTKVIDDSVLLLAGGYDFAAAVWRRAPRGARSVRMRLLGREAILVRGEEGVALFYDPNLIARDGAMPGFVQKTLFGRGSVHQLDGDRHRHRKSTFVDVAYDDRQVERLLPLLEEEWRAEQQQWLAGGTRSAYDAAVGAFGRSSMRWAGLPGTASARTRWAQRLAQIVDGFGNPLAPRFLMAAVNRGWSDRHARRLIAAVRAGELDTVRGTALHEWAWHRETHGALMSPDIAAVELQNSFRPMIAVARFVAFAAKELSDRPDWRASIATETAERGALVGGPLATMFAQEVRRTAPFVPLLPGRALTGIEFAGEHLDPGRRVVLDILGTDTDERSWALPAIFDPERFRGVDDYESLGTFIPHGGAGVATGHRCPGEKLAIAGLTAAIATLSDPGIEILSRGLRVDRRRLPTAPASGGHIRAVGTPSRCPLHFGRR